MSGDLERFFWSNDGPIVHKWLHYFPIYERYFGAFKGKPVRFLEIGVSKGGSLDMWRSYFGPEAVIFGIDIDPNCAEFDGRSGAVRIGSQDDPEFLAKVVEEMGGLDLVLDDGSHHSRHIRKSLDTLFPLLSDGGVYMIEDLHAAYWPSFGGGYRRPSSFMEVVKVMIDDMHHWYHSRGEKVQATAGGLSGLHVHDSITVLEKQALSRPAHAQRGRN
ncbi:class I SAM-dependent methyltransferase [Nioella aestuarii]|uniref:class I SAM-dependent methyltransferase n=1 Tax=Nioella aestuarii TaxID=1662864 RepID=UPI003D7FC2DB